MARTRREEPKRSPTLIPDEAIRLLRAQQEKGRALLSKRPITEDASDAWVNTTREVLLRALGEPPTSIDRFNNVAGVRSVFTGDEDEVEAYWEENRAKEITIKVAILDSCIEVLEIEASSSRPPKTPATKPSQASRDVFIVHGHDESLKEAVARFVSKLDLNPIILHEQPDKGRTVIEKFEQEQESAAFAIVLMTPDDIGADAQRSGDSKPRARQNVILEMGFFLGKLGRSRVCVLYDPSVEKPSDYEGVLYVSTKEDWKLKLIGELKAAGVQVDANRAFE